MISRPTPRTKVLRSSKEPLCFIQTPPENQEGRSACPPVKKTEIVDALEVGHVARDENKIMKKSRRRNQYIAIGDQLASLPKRTVDFSRSVDDLFGQRIDDTSPASFKKSGNLPRRILRAKTPKYFETSDDRELKDTMLLYIFLSARNDLRIMPFHDLRERIRIEENERRRHQGS
jgi:hypothetical protein